MKGQTSSPVKEKYNLYFGKITLGHVHGRKGSVQEFGHMQCFCELTIFTTKKKEG